MAWSHTSNLPGSGIALINILSYTLLLKCKDIYIIFISALMNVIVKSVLAAYSILIRAVAKNKPNLFHGL